MNDFPDEPLWTLVSKDQEQNLEDTPRLWTIAYKSKTDITTPSLVFKHGTHVVRFFGVMRLSDATSIASLAIDGQIFPNIRFSTGACFVSSYLIVARFYNYSGLFPGWRFQLAAINLTDGRLATFGNRAEVIIPQKIVPGYVIYQTVNGLMHQVPLPSRVLQAEEDELIPHVVIALTDHEIDQLYHSSNPQRLEYRNHHITFTEISEVGQGGPEHALLTIDNYTLPKMRFGTRVCFFNDYMVLPRLVGNRFRLCLVHLPTLSTGAFGKVEGVLVPIEVNSGWVLYLNTMEEGKKEIIFARLPELST